MTLIDFSSLNIMVAEGEERGKDRRERERRQSKGKRERERFFAGSMWEDLTRAVARNKILMT